MSQKLEHFLLVFDHNEGSLLEEVSFGTDGEGALSAYAHKEMLYRDRDDIEIVLIGSDSLATVRRTHANYYDGSVAVSKYLRGILGVA